VYFENHTKAIYKIEGKIPRICVLRERDRSELCHLLGFFLDVLALEVKTDSFSRNVGTELPLHAT